MQTGERPQMEKQKDTGHMRWEVANVCGNPLDVQVREKMSWRDTVGTPGQGYHCFCSFSKSCPTLCNPMDCSTLGFPVLYHLLELVQTHVCWVSDAIQPSHPLSPPSPPALNLSQHQGLFQWVSSLHQVAKYWSFSISPSNEYSGLISFRIDWFDLLAVQGTLKRLLQHHSSEASILRCPAFFIVQLSHPYMTTGKTIALTRLSFLSKVMSLILICCLYLS